MDAMGQNTIVINQAPIISLLARRMGKDFELHARIYEQYQLSKDNIVRLGASLRLEEEAFDIVNPYIVGD